MINKTRSLAVLMCAAIIPGTLQALTLTLPKDGSDVVGHNFVVNEGGGDATTIAHRYDIGPYELIEANRHIKPQYIPRGTRLVIPHEFILPKQRQGVVINLAELRLYYFPKGKDVVMTYPIGIGRVGRKTPLGETTIIQKKRDPDWRPTQNIRNEQLSHGVLLPKVIPAGPDNPLGPYAIRLGFGEYLIHGTNFPPGVGRRVSSGCIRMHNRDVAELFRKVNVGDPVTIENTTVKTGWSNGKLYVEHHQALSDDYRHNQKISALVEAAAKKHQVKIDWQVLREVESHKSGMPTVVASMKDDNKSQF